MKFIHYNKIDEVPLPKQWDALKVIWPGHPKVGSTCTQNWGHYFVTFRIFKRAQFDKVWLRVLGVVNLDGEELGQILTSAKAMLYRGCDGEIHDENGKAVSPCCAPAVMQFSSWSESTKFSCEKHSAQFVNPRLYNPGIPFAQDSLVTRIDRFLRLDDRCISSVKSQPTSVKNS